MSNRMTLSDCIALAEFAHRNQYDKAGEPYVKHPLRVLANVQAQGAQPYVQMAAVLHDVTEDTPFTPDMLLAFGVPDAAVRLVELLDRDLSKQTFSYVEQNEYNEVWVELNNFGVCNANDYYYYRIRNNPGALMVKLADIGDNTQPWRLSYLPEDTQARLRAKYAKAIELLTKE